jgi:hypothetical protein
MLHSRVQYLFEAHLDNSNTGFYYMSLLIANRICKKCGDQKALEWFLAFAKAWLDKDNLPEFPRLCWFNEEDDNTL